jgi:hypothetical protein
VIHRAGQLQGSPYWYTAKEVQQILRISRAGFFRYLEQVPLADRVKVRRYVTSTRTTRYWRISPNGLRIIGHLTGTAPYL